MGLIEKFSGKVVYLDTAPLIYFIEGNLKYFEFLKSIFEANDRGDFLFVTSAITIIEVLSFPNTFRDRNLVKMYDQVFYNSKTLAVLPVGFSEARTAAEYRVTHRLKTPDALHLATAFEYRADFFFTNDFDFHGKSPVALINLDVWLKKKK